MRLRYTARARLHLDAIAEYIAERNPDAARRVGTRIQETIDLLGSFPMMGRVGVTVFGPPRSGKMVAQVTSG